MRPSARQSVCGGTTHFFIPAEPLAVTEPCDPLHGVSMHSDATEALGLRAMPAGLGFLSRILPIPIRLPSRLRPSRWLWKASVAADRLGLPAHRFWPESVVPLSALHDQVAAILSAWGMSDDDVLITTRHLLYADLHGIDSHGCGMLRHYHHGRRVGALRMDARVTVVKDDGGSLLLDGGGGLGHVPSDQAMQLAIERARTLGIAAVTVRRSGHFGAAGTYVAMAAEAGMIGLATTNTGRPALVPTYGREAALGTNPIAFAAPADSQPPFLLDMATTTVPVGRVMTAWRRGEPIPEGWALDHQGRPLMNPGRAFRFRRLTPLGGSRLLGGHKGYGLATLVEILSATLPGLHAGDPDPHAPWRVGHFFLVIDPARFRAAGDFRLDLDALIERLRGTPPLDATHPVQVAGDPERQARLQRESAGIPLSRSLLEDLRFVSRAAGVPYRLESSDGS